MPRPSIEQIRGVGDFQMVHRWNMRFASFPVLGIAGAPLTEDLNIRCESATIPKVTTQSIEINLRGHKVKQPGISNYDNIWTLTFLETVDNIVRLFFKGWRESIWQTRTGISADKEELEATVILEQLNNQDDTIWQYTLFGGYLEDSDFGTLDGATSDAQRPSFTLSYDFFEDVPVA